MIDVEAILSGKTDMRTAIHAVLVERMCAGNGYAFDDDRLSRIGADSRRLMDSGASFPHAFSDALELELMMYGDPHARDTVRPMKVK